MRMDAQLREEYPEWETRDEFEIWLQERIAHQDLWDAQRSDPILTIPVVLHVVHNGFGVGVSDNISAAQIQSQIDVLNEDFRRMSGTAGFNTDSVGADTEIEFCLAYRAPDGTQLAEAGIDRVNRNFYGFTAPPYSEAYINSTIKPATIWDPTQYYNIWVVRFSNTSILGFAQFPSSSGLAGINANGTAQTDGVVIQPQYFGRTGSVSAPYNLGRTTTHEVGHGLGLRHIWGDDSCGVDDFCLDTPESNEGNYGCALNHNSCGSVDMVRNYMDYSDDACFNIFTLCQKSRMRTVLANSPRRKELPGSEMCALPVGIPVAAFTIDSSLACNGIYRFIDASAPFATNWVWTFSDGQAFTTRDPEVTFSAPGTYTVTMIANNALGTGTPLTTTITLGFGGTLNVSAGANQTIQPGGFTIIAASGASTYSWVPTTGLSNPNVSNPIAQPAVTTIYTVTGTNASGCTGQASMILFVAGTIGVEDLFGGAGTVHEPFPNPASSSITFSADLNLNGPLRIDLVDLTGRQVADIFDRQVGRGTFEFNWRRNPSLADGIYFAVWQLEGRRFVQKIQFY